MIMVIDHRFGNADLLDLSIGHYEVSVILCYYAVFDLIFEFQVVHFGLFYQCLRSLSKLFL